MEKKNNGLLIVTIILAVLLILSIGYTVYSFSESKKESNKDSNESVNEFNKEKVVNYIVDKFKFEIDDNDGSIGLQFFYEDIGKKETSYSKDYVSKVGIYFNEKSYKKYDKCPESIKQEMIEKGLTSENCEEFNFISKEDVEKIVHEYFGKNVTLGEIDYYKYLPDNAVYVKTRPIQTGPVSAELYDSKMTTNDEIELYYKYYFISGGPNRKDNSTVKYTFKLEDSNWIFYSANQLD